MGLPQLCPVAVFGTATLSAVTVYSVPLKVTFAVYFATLSAVHVAADTIVSTGALSLTVFVSSPDVHVKVAVADL